MWSWHKNRHTDQMNITESPEINLHGCDQFIYDKRAKNIQQGRDSPLNKQHQESWTPHTKEPHWTQSTLHTTGTKTPQFSTLRPFSPGSSEEGFPPAPSSQSHTGSFSPLFLTSLHFFPHRSLPVGPPWDGPEKTVLLSAWMQPSVVLKLKPQRVLRRLSTDSYVAVPFRKPKSYRCRRRWSFW